MINVLFLGYHDCRILSFLKNQKDINLFIEDSILKYEYIRSNNIELVISYGYRHIIKKEIINSLKNKIINLHISYLPWNKGADPNLWSFIDNTPKGVTIHVVDEGIDTGDILLQEEILLDDELTLYSSYTILNEKIQTLFIMNWESIKNNLITPVSQSDNGSFHCLKDSEKIKAAHDNFYNIKIKELKNILLQKKLI